MQPLQYDLRLSVAKHNRTPAAAAARHLGAAIRLRFAKPELQNRIELRTVGAQIVPICSSEIGSRLPIRKIINAKIEKNAAKAPFATVTQPVQYDLRASAAKHHSITLTAAAATNLDAAIPLESADTVLHFTI